ncbi:MAG: agmatine deiminase family protein, partial [Bacteroidota bacterium]
MRRTLPSFLTAILTAILFSLIALPVSAQNETGLPARMTADEVDKIPDYILSRAAASTGITAPPNFDVRTMAEWEEIEYLCVTWTQYISTVREIVRHAVEEVDVIIFCSDSNAVKSNLQNNGISTARVHYLERDFDSVWIRDYGANTIYKEDVDSLMLVDWIYNRPRPNDDVIPQELSTYLGLPL